MEVLTSFLDISKLDDKPMGSTQKALWLCREWDFDCSSFSQKSKGNYHVKAGILHSLPRAISSSPTIKTRLTYQG